MAITGDKYSRSGLMADLLVTAVPVMVFGIFKTGLTYHFHHYSYFSLHGTWCKTFLESPGSCLDYLGAFFTQFCGIPVLGAFLLGLLLVLLRRLVIRSAGGGPAVLYLSIIPAMMIILFISGMDYSVFLSKYYGLMFSQAIGLISSVGIYMPVSGRKHISNSGVLLLSLIIAACFPITGFYALLAGFMIALHFVSVCRKPGPAVIIAILCIALPLACRYCDMFYQKANLGYLFSGGLPIKDFVGDCAGIIPLLAAVLTILLIPFARMLKTSPSACSIICAASVTLVFVFTNWDHNFNALLAMEKAVSEENWDKVLDIAKKSPRPTRPMVVYRNIALYNNGQLCDKMFEYPDGSEPFESRTSVPMSLTYAPEAYYHTGLLNYAERWATELSVSYTKGLNRLKSLSKVALLSGDIELAEKYFYLIDRTFRGRVWTARYKGMISDPELIRNDPEFTAILPLLDSSGARVISGDVAETTILTHFANVEATGSELLEWKMASLMSLKRESGFMDEFLAKYKDRPVDAIPEGIGQAAVLFGGISGDEGIYRSVFSIFKENEQLLKRFSSFGHSMSANPDISSESVIERYRSQYGKTFWFYYYFVNDITTN